MKRSPHSPRQRPKHVAPPRRTGWTKRLIYWLLFLIVGFYTFCFLCLLYVKGHPPLSTSVQVQRRLEAMVAWEPYTKRYSFVSLRNISESLVHAVVASEDARFFEHHGIDWIELQTVVSNAWQHGRFARGGSTITQQLVKNLFLTTYRSFLRKTLEFTLAPLVELVLSKKQILELYLNVVEWGPGVYGAEAAAEFHYGISAGHLSREQAARLAACLPAPQERLPDEMDSRSANILERMRSMGW